jgi:hypothetical protein
MSQASRLEITEPSAFPAAPGSTVSAVERIRWPDNKDFAFTIFDDTDSQTVENVGPVYRLLADLGLRTTKSVWPLRGDKTPRNGGATCEDHDYLRWVLGLQAEGFEIALHNATYHTSVREDTIRGMDRFRDLFGHDPVSMANHTGCLENIYWGNYRLTGVHEKLYNLLLRNKYKGVFQGHIESSPLFWGDVCRRRIKYVRNFAFGDANTLNACPFMPYHDPSRPYVNNWFAAALGPSIGWFNKTLSERAQDRLAEQGGACIMYAHLAWGFHQDRRFEPRFKSLIERLSKMNGWFVPVRTLLDFLLEQRGPHVITADERRRLERRWLTFRLLKARGTT